MRVSVGKPVPLSRYSPCPHHPAFRHHGRRSASRSASLPACVRPQKVLGCTLVALPVMNAGEALLSVTIQRMASGQGPSWFLIITRGSRWWAPVRLYARCVGRNP